MAVPVPGFAPICIPCLEGFRVCCLAMTTMNVVFSSGWTSCRWQQTVRLGTGSALTRTIQAMSCTDNLFLEDQLFRTFLDESHRSEGRVELGTLAVFFSSFQDIEHGRLFHRLQSAIYFKVYFYFQFLIFSFNVFFLSAKYFEWKLLSQTIVKLVTYFEHVKAVQ